MWRAGWLFGAALAVVACEPSSRSGQTRHGGKGADPADIQQSSWTSSCAKRCGAHLVGAPCQCDPGCAKNGDCCPDYGAVCQSPDGGAAPAPDTAGGTPVEGACKAGCGPGLVCNVQGPKGGLCVPPTCAAPADQGLSFQRVSRLTIPVGNADGCDFDADGKGDNRLGAAFKAFKSQIDNIYGTAIADGSLVRLLIGKVPAGAAVPAKLKLQPGKVLGAAKKTFALADDAWNAGTPGTGPCAMVADVGWSNVKLEQGALTAGAPGDRLRLPMPLFTVHLEMELRRVSLRAKLGAAWPQSPITGGLICGVWAKDDLEAAIDAIPDKELASLGGKDVVKQIIAGVLTADLDLDGDGTKESISALIAFDATFAPQAP